MRTNVYAAPAPKPPRAPISAGNAVKMFDVGFIINKLPVNAIITLAICTMPGFSFNKNTFY